MPTQSVGSKIKAMRMSWRRLIPDDIKAVYAESKEMSDWIFEKQARHVRTAAGEQRYGQPIGSIIVRDRPLKNLTLLESQYEGWELVQGSNGKRYEIGQDEGNWVATLEGDDTWEPVASGKTLDETYLALDKVAGGQAAASKPTVNAPGGGQQKMREATAADRKRLVIPPAWTNVMIAEDPNASLVATGLDAKGRKQYRYSKLLE